MTFEKKHGKQHSSILCFMANDGMESEFMAYKIMVSELVRKVLPID